MNLIPAKYHNLLFWIQFGIYTIVGIVLLNNYDGIGDSGDSTYHYLFSKWSWAHPENFFNHWAKPLFTLLSSPFTQFGKTGMKLFNLLMSLITIYFTYRTATKLKYNNAYLIPILLLFSSFFIVYHFTGLTEPMFSAVLSIIIFLSLNEEKLHIPTLILSFLPFIRSEGLIIFCVYILFLLFKRKAKLIPILAIGHIVYAVAGYPFHGDLLWVFNTMSYAVWHSAYGSGELLHFVNNMLFVLGIPITVVFVVGMLVGLHRLIRNKGYISSEECWLIFAMFTAYLVAHTLFWYLGKFNSFGLIRVMVGIFPPMALISLIGFNFLIGRLSSKLLLARILSVLFIGYVLVFPWVKNIYAVHWNYYLGLLPEQQAANICADWIKENNLEDRRIAYAATYMSEALDRDHFDKEKVYFINWENPYKNTKKGDLIIWDDAVFRSEERTDFDVLDADSSLKLIYGTDKSDAHYRIVRVYEKVK